MNKGEKVRIGVAFGGPSSEHKISIATAINVFSSLNRDEFEVWPIYITKQCKFIIPFVPISNPEQLRDFEKDLPNSIRSEALPPAQAGEILTQKFDVVFNAMHGPFGEDGTFQAFLKTLGIPCTGSNYSSSALAMDKMRSRMVMKAHHIPVPETVYLRSGENNVPFMPTVIKPNAQGSSVGVTVVKEQGQLKEALKEAFKFDDIVLAEEFLDGKEITCGVLDMPDAMSIALPVTLILPKIADFFDIKAKYEIDGSEEITPAPISDNATKLAKDLAVKTHKTLGCNGVTRTDMILMGDDSIKVLEINTLPGMTDTSLVPQAANTIGISFQELLSLIVKEALNRGL